LLRGASREFWCGEKEFDSVWEVDFLGFGLDVAICRLTSCILCQYDLDRAVEHAPSFNEG
jgi:hypothetical protein